MPQRFVLGILPLAMLVTSSLVSSRSSGVLPGELLVPPSLTSSLPACGQCHDVLPNANGRVKLAITPSTLSLAAGAPITVAVKVTGGPATTSAGFAMEASAGSFVAGVNSRTTASGNAITHTDKFGDSWSFGFQAPTTPGLVTWTAVGQKADLDLATTGDSFGFYGPNSDNPGVALRLFVNAVGVQPFGTGCAGADDHVPVLGAATGPALGQGFALSLVAVPAGAPTFLALGDSTTTFGGVALPFDLVVIGAAGCAVRTNHLVVLPLTATGQGSGGGVAGITLTVPSDPALRGKVLHLQALVVDAAANGLGLTVSNGLTATFF